MPFEVSTTRGIDVAVTVPSSGMVTWKSDSSFEQERLELLVGAVDLVDQQHRRVGAADGGEQRPLEQIVLREDVLLDRVGVARPSRALMARSWRW